MTANGLDSIKDEFLKIYTAMKDLSKDDILNDTEGIFNPYFEKLQELMALEINDSNAEKMLSDPGFQSITQHIARLKTIHGLKMEINRANKLITSTDPWAVLKSFRFHPNYLKLAQMEYEGGKLNPGDTVVFLGSGPLPLSLISLCTQKGVNGIGIEQEVEYAQLSRNVIKNLGLTDHVKIIQGNHFLLPLEEKCDLVMVGADAIPKDEIFNLLAEMFPFGTKFSYRIYEKGLRRFMDKSPVTNLPPVLQEYARIRPEPPVNNTSIFLIKR